MNKKIIALTGIARSGKDTTADYLVQKYGYIRLAYADIMKSILCSTFNITPEELEAYKNDKYSFLAVFNAKQSMNTYKYPYDELKVNFRNILENFGQSMKALFGEKVWSNLIVQKIKELNHDKIVVSDVRFHVEIDGLRENFNDITLLRIVNGRQPASDHPAEVQHLEFNDYTLIDNTKDLEWLYKQIYQIVQQKETL